MPNIEMQTHIYKELKARILAANPELDADDQALLDTLEGETDLREGLIAVMRQADMDESLANGLADRIEEMRVRRDRLSARAGGRREMILWAMQEAGISKIEAPEFTVSTAKVPGSVVITDQSILPAEYLRHKEPEPDKKAIAQAFKDGKEVPGATKSNGGVRLSVRKA